MITADSNEGRPYALNQSGSRHGVGGDPTGHRPGRSAWQREREGRVESVLPPLPRTFRLARWVQRQLRRQG